jgi:hypothetical protein
VPALIEKRFLGSAHLTLRDEFANDLEDLFDFANSPSLNNPITTAEPPKKDCTPVKAP